MLDRSIQTLLKIMIRFRKQHHHGRTNSIYYRRLWRSLEGKTLKILYTYLSIGVKPVHSSVVLGIVYSIPCPVYRLEFAAGYMTLRGWKPSLGLIQPPTPPLPANHPQPKFKMQFVWHWSSWYCWLKVDKISWKTIYTWHCIWNWRYNFIRFAVKYAAALKMPLHIKYKFYNWIWHRPSLGVLILNQFLECVYCVCVFSFFRQNT